MQTQITAAQVYNNTLPGGPAEEELKHLEASGIFKWTSQRCFSLDKISQAIIDDEK